jgi:hypothetical protein
VAQATSTLGDAIRSNPELVSSVARQGLLSFPEYRDGVATTSTAAHLRDLGAFADNLSAASELAAIAKAARDVRSALDRAAVASDRGTARTRQVGVSVELPLGTSLSTATLTSYRARSSAWIAATHWDEVLALLLAKRDNLAPNVAVNLTSADPPALGSPVNVTLLSSDPDITLAESAVWRRDPSAANKWQNVGHVAITPMTPSDTVGVEWDGTLLAVGPEKQLVTTRPWLFERSAFTPAPQPVLSVLGRLARAGVPDAPARLLFNAQRDRADTLAVTVDETTRFLAVAEAAAGGEAFFVPLLQERSGASLSEADGAPIRLSPFGDLAVETISARAGAYRIEAVGLDAWGNRGNAASGEVTAP